MLSVYAVHITTKTHLTLELVKILTFRKEKLLVYSPLLQHSQGESETFDSPQNDRDIKKIGNLVSSQ